MKPRPMRRIVTDLTPLIDMVTILLFGVMIHSVTRTEADVAQTGGEQREANQELERANVELRRRLESAEAELAKASADKSSLERRLREQKLALAEAVARLLQMNEGQHRALREHLEKLSGAKAQALARAYEELRDAQDPVEIYKAIRRIEEMQKVFTFVDLHVNEGLAGAGESLKVVAAGRELEPIPLGGRTPEEIEEALRRALEAVTFQPMVLFLFSYDGEARDRTVEAAESAVTSLLSHYRSQPAGQGRQFRFGRVGLIDAPRPAS